MFKHGIMAAMASFAMLVTASGTQAQTAKYYLRTVVAPAEGVKAPVYVATYASTFSACSGGTQSKAVASCRKDGVVVSNAQCSPMVQSCKSCANVARNYAVSGGQAYPLGSFRNGSDLTPACSAKSTELGQAGVCYWDMRAGTTDGPAWFYAGGAKATGAYGELGSYCS